MVKFIIPAFVIASFIFVITDTQIARSSCFHGNQWQIQLIDTIKQLYVTYICFRPGFDYLVAVNMLRSYGKYENVTLFLKIHGCYGNQIMFISNID